MSGRFSIFVLISLVLTVPIQARPADDEPKVTGTGRAVYVDGELLKDYDPKPALVTKVTATPKPKFPAIDIHCHWTLQQDPALLLKAMDEVGVTSAINLSGGYGANLEHMLKRFHDAALQRLLIFANLDFNQIDDPQFASKMCDFLE